MQTDGFVFVVAAAFRDFALDKKIEILVKI